MRLGLIKPKAWRKKPNPACYFLIETWNWDKDIEVFQTCGSPDWWHLVNQDCFSSDQFLSIHESVFLTPRIWKSQNVICMSTSKVLFMLSHCFHVGLYMIIVISVILQTCCKVLLVLSKGNMNISLKCLYRPWCRSQISSKTCIIFAVRLKAAIMSVLQY